MERPTRMRPDPPAERVHTTGGLRMRVCVRELMEGSLATVAAYLRHRRLGRGACAPRQTDGGHDMRRQQRVRKDRFELIATPFSICRCDRPNGASPGVVRRRSFGI